MTRALSFSCALAVAALAVGGTHAADPVKAEAVKITRQGDDFVLTTPVYQARVNGKTGLLEQLTIDGETAVAAASIDLEKRPITKIDVVQEGPDKVAAYFSAEDDKKPVDKALRVSYEVQPNTLLVKTLSTVGHVSGRGMRFEMGKGAQMVRSLDYRETVPMPVLQGRSPWMGVKFTFANGTTLGILNEGAGNPFNPNENGGVGGWTYSRGGYVANGEYVYTLVAERGGRKTLGAPAMKVREAATPAVFFQGDKIQATLEIAKENYRKLEGLKGLRVKYEVQDVFEATVARGEAPLELSGGADPLVVRVPLAVEKLGWYRAYFTVNDAAGDLLEGKERLIFSVLKRQSDLGDGFANEIQTDYSLGLGFFREKIPDQDVKRLEQLLAQREAEAKGTDVTVSYQIEGPPPGVGNDPKKFAQFCQDVFGRVPNRVPRVEIINEPDGTMQPREYVDTFLRPAYENIKKASPQTKVLGPVLCGMSPNKLHYVEELYKLGLKDLTDELTFHPYGGNFDDGPAVEAMQGLAKIIAANKDQDKPIHFTESGYSHGGWSDLDGMREVVKYLVAQYAWQNAILGVDHRHNSYYFTDQMGYLDFWLRSNQLTPAAVAMRTYTGFVKGQGRARRLDLGSLEVVRAFAYPGTDRQVVLLWTSGNRDQTTTTDVTFETDAKEVEWFDVFGNPLAAAVADGRVKLAVGTFPSYLVVPGKAKLTPVPERWGVNVALAALGAVAEASSEEGTRPAVGAIDGDAMSQTGWRSLTPNDLPQSLTVTLAGPAEIDRVGLWSYSARGYDLEAMGADGKWVKLVSRRDQPYRRFRTETFAPLVTDQVRLTVVDSYTDRAEVAEFQVFSRKAAGGKAAELVNWALKSNGATAKASSEMSKEVTVAVQDWGAKAPRVSKVKLEGKAENAIDGKRLVNDWREFFPTTWVAAPGAELPQWLEITFDKPRPISSVVVYTIAFAGWTPENSGVRDWDVQVWDGKNWRTADEVRGNKRVSKISRLKAPIQTEKIRIVVRGTNDPEGTVGLMEVEAFGPRQEP